MAFYNPSWQNHAFAKTLRCTVQDAPCIALYLVTYNPKRPHQGRNMKGRTPLQTLLDGMKDLNPEPEKTVTHQAAQLYPAGGDCQSNTVAAHFIIR